MLRKEGTVTRRHYIKIAEIIDMTTTHGGLINKEKLLEELCDFFKSENPRFDKDKFTEACTMRDYVNQNWN